MNKFSQIIGNVIYFLLSPFIYLILHKSTRSRVIIHYKDQILLTKTWLSNGKWSLPGGGMKNGEVIEAAAIREVYEETNVKLNINDLKFIGDYKQRFFIFIINQKLFEVKLFKKPTIKRQKYEISGISWFDLKETSSDKFSKHTILMLRKMGG